MSDSFPRLHARTRRFTLGAPRGFTVAPDGSRAVFLRSRDGTDPVTCLWSIDARTGQERLLVDPAALAPDGEENLPAAERARRERVREQAGGVVGYACDADVERAVFALSGRLYLVALTGEPAPRALPVGDVEAVVDPRLDPTGSRVAFVADRALHVHDVAAGTTTVLRAPDGEHVSHGLADFAAAEEMNRTRGYWWSPDGAALLVARVDESPVPRWHIADPASPDRTPTSVAYPAAGTSNATVGLEVVRLDGSHTPVLWSAHAYEYLVTARWDARGALVVVQPRDQRELRTLSVEPATGETTLAHSDVDPVWTEIVPGTPVTTADGTLVRAVDRDGARRLVDDGDTPLTPTSMQVRDVLAVEGDTVLFRASTDPVSVRLFTVTPGSEPVAVSPEHGVHTGTMAGGTLVRTSTDLEVPPRTALVRADGTEVPVASHAADPGLVPHVAMHVLGERGLRTAVLLPGGHEPGTRLPVLLDPYGGPHSQRVLAARNGHLTSQWFADHGFAVVVADGRGTPGRSPEFERAVHLDLASPVLDDQVDALHAAAAEYPDLDLGRVGIRGWSFGGYLAALAVLRRPDVFHAAVAGAPVTDWALYDTHYTERYLGADTSAESYRRSSLLSDAATPADREHPNRPLMIIHGLADDNVVAAHTLRLSSALLAAGRAHEVLPLSGVTHMTPQEVVAENLLLLQVQFLRNALAT